MPNTREKLIELMNEAEEHATDICAFNDTCENCIGRKYGNQCRDYLKADHLIANGVTIQEWIPVSERLPEEDGKYLVFEQSGGRTVTSILQFAKDARKVNRYDFKGRWKNAWYEYDSEWGHYTVDSVTHWMPLPTPPKGE